MAMSPQCWNPQPFDPKYKWIRLDEVKEIVFRSEQVIYAHMGKGAFPVPAKLSPRISVWREDEVKQWLIDSTKANGYAVVEGGE
ncbi:MAG: helix-turn-helix transcriptional regulator [Scandinavium sp.]|uniref:helix-turn-helix transcriptional regulator n=1 Tax=Scandinavium sp. TaxID=2830653 RepID=UPI003F3E1551